MELVEKQHWVRTPDIHSVGRSCVCGFVRRIHDLKQDLARMRRECGAWDSDQYEREASGFADRLSQTWERLVSQEVAGRIFDRGSMEVKITMMKIAASITSDDNKALQESYHRCSGVTIHVPSAGMGGVQGLPVMASRRTVRVWMPCLRAVEM